MPRPRALCLLLVALLPAVATAEPLPPGGHTLAVLPGDETETLSLLDSTTGKELRKIKLDMIRRDDNRLRWRRVQFGLDGDDEERTEGGVTFSPDGKHLAVLVGQTVT